ncbi:MAG: hypothetical protein CTY39_12305 [Hyphomicrobium sp.]|nr:MAG: hypothetical protein CTY39_12305 [Hyphomicrobium sp.]
MQRDDSHPNCLLALGVEGLGAVGMRPILAKLRVLQELTTSAHALRCNAPTSSEPKTSKRMQRPSIKAAPAVDPNLMQAVSPRWKLGPQGIRYLGIFVSPSNGNRAAAYQDRQLMCNLPKERA